MYDALAALAEKSKTLEEKMAITTPLMFLYVLLPPWESCPGHKIGSGVCGREGL
jgi:hypothetical protein